MNAQNEKAMQPKKVFITFFRMIGLGMPKWLFCFLGVTLIGLASYGFSLLSGMLLSVSLDHFAEGTSAVPAILLLLLALFGVMWMLAGGYIINLSAAMGIRARIQKRLISVWMNQTEAFASKHHSSDAMTLVTSDMEIVEDFYFQGLMTIFLLPLVQGIAAICTMAAIDWRLFLAPVVTGLISLYFSVRFSQKLQEKTNEVRTKTDHLTKSFTEIMNGNTAYRMMGITTDIAGQFEEENSAYAKSSAETKNVQIKITFIAQLLDAVSIVCFFAVGLWLAGSGRLDFSLVLLAFPLQSRVSEFMNCFGATWNFIITAGASGDRILNALEWPQEDKMEDRAALPAEHSATLELSGIHFGYEEGKQVLKDFNAKIQKGQKLALVGSSGSGKSTVLQLLFRFYNQNAGTISLGGVTTDQCSLDTWRSSFVLLQQDSPLLAKTIRENIAMGLYGNGENPSDEQIIAAAKAAGIHDFIQSLPEGYHTVVTEGGKNFSGGQRQRIAIARAFLSRAPIVLLDEPTAALDIESEKLVQESLDSLMQGRTVIMVAHRLQTVQNFDNILVLHQGRVIESGSHEQLMEKNGAYAQLYRAQALDAGQTAKA